MKRFVSLAFLGFVVFLGFVACNGVTTEGVTTAAPTTVAPTTVAPTTAAPTTVVTTKESFTSLTAYLAYASSDWGAQYWGPGNEGNTAGVVGTTAAVSEYGTAYTVAVDLSAVTANGFAFMDVEITDGEDVISGCFMEINEVSINGSAVSNLGATYTSSDDDETTRTNLYNTWVSGIVEGRTADGRFLGASATPVDVSEYTTITSISVTFTLHHGVELAPRAYLQFADGDWSDAQAWYDAATAIDVDGYGQYTVSLDFTDTANGYANGIAFFDVEVSNGEIFYPKSALSIDSVVINGIPLAIGRTYTSSDNENDTRVNLYNTWVANIEEGRTANGIIEGISATPVDASGIPHIETIEVTFTLGDGYYLGEVAPTPLPRQGTTAYFALADNSWAVQYWGPTSTSNTDGVVVNLPVITGYGQYTTSIDFSGVEGGVLPDITFFGLEVTGGEQYFPYNIIHIDALVINGVDVTAGLGNPYTTSDNGFETRVNIYNAWVSEITGNRFASGLTLEDVTATPLDVSAIEDIITISVTFTIEEGEFFLEVIDEFEGYELPESFNAFMMFSDTGGFWESYAPGTDGDCDVLGDGVYVVSLSADDIGATGQAVAGQVFLIDIEGLGKAMRFMGTLNDENDTDLEVEIRVFVDGTEVTVNNANILKGDLEGNDRLRLEFYNTWGTGTADNPVVSPDVLTPETEIVVWFKLVGTGLNTDANLDWPTVTP